MTENMIEKFVNSGFKRWTKDNMDRLYINAESLGLEITRYKTGNIFSAKFNGDEISNNMAREMLASKIWIDISTGNLMSKTGASWTLVQATQDLMDEIIEQYEQEQTQAQSNEESADNENAENDADAVSACMYVHEFTQNMFDNAVDFPPVSYTLREAMYDLKNWRADELDVPDDLTPLLLVAEMNHLTGEYITLNDMTDEYAMDEHGIWRKRSDS